MKRYYLFLLPVVSILLACQVWACDPCAIYNAARLQGHSAGAFTVSVSEQFTDFDMASDSKSDAARDGEFVRDFSTTQFAFGYDFSERFGVQLTVPVIARRFQEVEHYRRSFDADSGLGDISLLGTYSFLNYREENWAVVAGLTAGVKFPTGDTGVLEDISDDETESFDLEGRMLKNHPIGSTSAGRALTFGTGSYDYITGVNLLTRYERYLLLAHAQYTIRTEGDFDYEFDDDFLWSVGPGYYVVLEDEYTIAALLALTGEYKGEDKLDGQALQGSKVSNVFLGPEVLFTIADSISGEVALDFRVSDEDDGATIVPEVRIRTGLAYRFS